MVDAIHLAHNNLLLEVLLEALIQYHLLSLKLDLRSTHASK